MSPNTPKESSSRQEQGRSSGCRGVLSVSFLSARRVASWRHSLSRGPEGAKRKPPLQRARAREGGELAAKPSVERGGSNCYPAGDSRQEVALSLPSHRGQPCKATWRSRLWLTNYTHATRLRVSP